MQFLNAVFWLFFPCLFLLYNCINKRYRYLCLLVANYLFYGWNNFAAVPALLISTVITYCGGLIMEVVQPDRRRMVYTAFFAANLLILGVYKYTEFLLSNLCGLMQTIGVGMTGFSVDLITPVGLSFYIFQSSSYLSDVYRKGMPAEHNLFRYAAFASFFPTILSGPIQRSRDLLPQLNNPSDFQFERARRGFLVLVWGLFQKIVISGKLAGIADTVYNAYTEYDNVYYLVAACCYSLYIYCDFSAYSDMACGIAEILGFQIKGNFRNPYLAESLADFWNRWHMSLNTWFIENIYIPLGGNRKGATRKYCNILIVFALSGIWHGAGWNFVVWGLLNGALRIMGEILQPIKNKVYAITGTDQSVFSIRFLKKAGVFLIITVTWVFFRIPDLASAIHIVKNMLFFHPTALFNPGVFSLFGTVQETLVFVICVAVFLSVQYLRKEEGGLLDSFCRQPVLVQSILLAVAICICILIVCSGTTTFNTEFIYFQF